MISRLSKNILYNLAGQGTILILGAGAAKFMFSRLGEEGLGLIYFAVMLSAVIVAVLDLGIGATTVREVSSNHLSKPVYVRDLVRTAGLFYWSAYGLIALATYLATPFLVKGWIHLKVIDPEVAIRALRILLIAALLSLPRSLYTSILRGLQRMEFNNLVDALAIALQQIGIILILYLGGNLFHVVYWFAGVACLAMLGYLFFVAVFFSPAILVPGYSGEVVRQNLGYSSRMMAISLLSMVHSQADKVIVSKLLPVGLLGVYMFSSSMANRMSLLTGAIAQGVFPSFSALFAGGNTKALKLQYVKFQDLVCFGTLPLFAALSFGARPVLAYLFNPDLAHKLLLPVILLSVGFYMNGTLTIPYMLSLAVGKPGIAARLNFYAIFTVLPVTLACVYWGGLVGAGFSWVFYNLFAYYYGVPRICSECLGMKPRVWYYHVLRIFLLAGATYGLALVAAHFFFERSVVALAVGYAAASAVFLAASYAWIGTDLRETILRHLSLVRGKSMSALTVNRR